MNNLKKVKTLFIDLDGTLLAHSFLLRPLFIIKAIIFLKRKKITFWQGLEILENSKKALEQTEGNNSFNVERAILALGAQTNMSAEDAAGLYFECTTSVFSSLKKLFTPIAPALEFIKWAEGRYNLVLATNPVWPLELVLLRLSWGKIKPGIFSFISHSGNMHYTKPSQHYFKELLEKLDLEASEVLMIGDNFKKDGAAANEQIATFILSKSKRSWPISEYLHFGDFSRLQSLLEQANK